MLRLVGGKYDARPLAESWRADADIDGYVENFALDHAAEFRLRMRKLIVQSAESAAA